MSVIHLQFLLAYFYFKESLVLTVWNENVFKIWGFFDFVMSVSLQA